MSNERGKGQAQVHSCYQTRIQIDPNDGSNCHMETFQQSQEKRFFVVGRVMRKYVQIIRKGIIKMPIKGGLTM